MFKKIKRWFKRRFASRQCVKGLSKAMSIVDAYMCQGLTPKALDRAYGQAYAQIKIVYINGEITWNELQAAIVTLDNQYNKLRPKAVEAMIYT